MALEPNERPGPPITKFESMLKTDDIYFFDAEDFEDIIHHYLNNGKIALAKKAIKISLEQHPDSIELKLLFVEVLVFENNLDLAEQLLDELQSIDSSNEEIYIQRANIFSKKDNHEAAVMLLHEALNLTDDSFDIHSLLGMEYLFMDNFEDAKLNFMKCVSHDEHDYQSLYNVIYCFEFLEEHDGAILYLNDYLERNPYSEVAWHQLGKMYFEKKLYKEALAAFDFAVISDDTFIGAYFEKGKVLEKLGRYNEAIENYEITIEMEDPTSHAYLRIGRCHEKLQNEELAKSFYYRTVHEDPLLDKGWLAITDYYIRQKDFTKALYYINKAINLDGENAKYWKKCARIHATLKNNDEAYYAYQQAVDLGYFEFDIWFHWANVAIQNFDVPSAIEILLQGIVFYPDRSEMQYKLAGFYLLISDFEKAQHQLINALKIDIGQLHLFKKEFPQFYHTDWAKNLIQDIKKASR
ncbi:Tfp pilus assembly protein PilF [Arenibacter nanhaiticus]|uniref:Tfp pilus assembly protein PilF n=1 Tax=Arenibacter nanhaiticus TaxID=558155 RepID=A0A1M6J0W8_9FLAO|nr:tetratricopeptide repeat protein [Arenibacter nanhaiticus]SHJ40305.1 Tfp pilus assembly protein PilF [Arenibacter nanhaiticus]